MTEAESGLSALRKQKLLHLFRLIDVNRNGYIERDDLKNMVSRIAFAREIGETDDNRILLEETLTRLWERLAPLTDTNFDGHVTHAEWLALFEHASSERVFYEGIVRPIEVALINLIDTDGNGRITYSDYREMVLAWNVNESELSHMFRLIDLDRNGRISRVEAEKAIREFFMSDEDLPGNWFFGDYQRT
ncbi:MAG: EF-hand domain-containing protein [Chloroflexota bacterium]